MKKILTLMGCGFLCVALSGCSGSSADVVCTKESDQTSETYSIYTDDDKNITKAEMEMKAEASTEEEAKMVEGLYSGIFEGMAEQSKGAIECDIDRSGKSLTVLLTVDVKAAKEAGIDDGAVIPDTAKLDDFVKEFEAKGYKCD